MYCFLLVVSVIVATVTYVQGADISIKSVITPIVIEVPVGN